MNLGLKSNVYVGSTPQTARLNEDSQTVLGKGRLFNRDFGFPSKNGIILVVTVSGFWVADPASMIFILCRSECSSNSFP